MTDKKNDQGKDKNSPTSIKELTSAEEVKKYLLAMIPNWRNKLLETRANASGSLYVELTGRLDFLGFLAQEVSTLPIAKEKTEKEKVEKE